MRRLRLPKRVPKEERIRSIQEAWRATPHHLRHMFRAMLWFDSVEYMRRDVGFTTFREAVAREHCTHCLVCLVRRTRGNDVFDDLPVMHCGDEVCGRMLKNMKVAERRFYDSRRVAYLVAAEDGRAAA